MRKIFGFTSRPRASYIRICKSTLPVRLADSSWKSEFLRQVDRVVLKTMGVKSPTRQRVADNAFHLQLRKLSRGRAPPNPCHPWTLWLSACLVRVHSCPFVVKRTKRNSLSIIRNSTKDTPPARAQRSSLINIAEGRNRLDTEPRTFL